MPSPGTPKGIAVKKVATYKFPKKELCTGHLAAMVKDLVDTGIPIDGSAKVSVLAGFKTVEFKVEVDDDDRV